jgi:hypothetical protein
MRRLLERLTEKQRKRITLKDFVFPERRAWPIQSVKQAKAAIQSMRMGRGDESEYPEIIDAIRARYGDDGELMNLLSRV